MKTTLNLSFLFSIILIFIISCSPLRNYKTTVTGWEQEIRNFEHRDSVETYSKDAVLFIGSSSIRLWSTIQEDMLPYEVIQRGFGGAKISDLAWYMKRIAYPHPCKAIVIFVANDITGVDEDKTPEEIARLFQYTVKTIRSRFPETPIFYIQVTPTESRWKVWGPIEQGNQLIKNKCKLLHRVYFIETATNYLDETGNPRKELFLADKLHLSPKGYAIWAEIIKKNLKAMLK
jgi:lysophospholipase L1-like esterase